MRALLSPAGRAREPRFHYQHDRMRYLLTRALVRAVLPRHAPVAPAAGVQNGLDLHQAPPLRQRTADAAAPAPGMAPNSLEYNGIAATADATDPRP